MGEPPTPYRDGKPLAELIPPDRRAQKLAAIIVASMALGVLLWVMGGVMLDRLRADAYTPPVPSEVPYDEPPPPDEPPRPEDLPRAATLNAESIERVVASHRAALNRRCWATAPAPKPKRVSVTVSLTIDPKGHVAQVSSTGDDAAMRRCLEREIKAWVFPAPASDTQVSLPFRFAAE